MKASTLSYYSPSPTSNVTIKLSAHEILHEKESEDNNDEQEYETYEEHKSESNHRLERKK